MYKYNKCLSKTIDKFVDRFKLITAGVCHHTNVIFTETSFEIIPSRIRFNSCSNFKHKKVNGVKR